MSPTYLTVTVLAFLASNCIAHSWLSEPQNTAPRECALGGAVKPNGPIRTCPGPCDVAAATFLKNASPERPAAVYGRGQTVTIKYNRNNHGPGGFVRMTLVPLDKMMDEETHKTNAFHYSCWGAHTVEATPADIAKDRFGFNIAGGDGSLHDLPIAYHVVNITIPPVVPNGDYVLGWAWFGGIGGPIETNTASNPFQFGFFADYWACSFVRISGGQRLERSYKPVFVNDFSNSSTAGCFAAFDDTGLCKVEPCRDTRGSYQMPKAFKNGGPGLLTTKNFRSRRCSQEKKNGFCGGTPTPKPLEPVLQEAFVDLYTCRYPGFVA